MTSKKGGMYRTLAIATHVWTMVELVVQFSSC
jgi:hypothetical protein